MVSVFAPVNIAWIKYMGKENGVPTNSSFSMTLDQVGTRTHIKKTSNEGELRFTWSEAGYVPPESGRDKAERFLKTERIWREGFANLGYDYNAPFGHYEIETFNNVPAGTGIATSASGFAALTLAWTGILMGDQFEAWSKQFSENNKVRAKVADLAKLGSGSASRSLDGPWVEWDPRQGIHLFEGSKLKFTDFILIIDEDTKAVSSTEAHARVMTSRHFLGRVGRAEARLAQVKLALKHGDLKGLTKSVLDEALDMHDLFHTSEPPFSYLKPASRHWIDLVQSKDQSLPSQSAVLTLDAGANVHLFVPESEESIWETFLKSGIPGFSFVKARAGKGAYYVHSGN